MKEFASYLANLPKTPLVEAVQSLYESCFGPWNFKSVQELRDFVDQKTYERFKLYSKDEVASGKTPFGSLEAIKAIDMDTFLKSVGDKGYDIEDDMKNQLVDANYINNLSYDWFICLFNMKVLGWSQPVTEASGMALGVEDDGTYSLEEYAPNVDLSHYPKWVRFLADKIDLRRLPNPRQFNEMMPYQQRLCIALLAATPDDKERYNAIKKLHQELLAKYGRHIWNIQDDDERQEAITKMASIQNMYKQWREDMDAKLKALAKGTRLPSRDNGKPIEFYDRDRNCMVSYGYSKPRVGRRQMENYKHKSYNW
jgi:hypothetical protein